MTSSDDEDEGGVRRSRSTRRRQDAPDLPRIPMEQRTVGRTFTAADGTVYRPSMFVTLTLPSYGRVRDGVPVDPAGYDYRRAALDALLFPRLLDRFWQNLRRCAGYRVQYFSAIEAQRRLAPHLHAAIRGAIPRATLKAVVRATYHQVWWPSFEDPVVRRAGADLGSEPWAGTWTRTPARSCRPGAEALDELDADPHAAPAHVLRFGSQLDMKGLLAGSADADRAVRYLCKYLTKAIADTYTPDQAPADPAYEAHINRLHEQVRWLPCSSRCANWLRYGVQPEQRRAGPGAGIVSVAGARPGEPRPGGPAGARLAGVDRQDPHPTPGRPRRRGASRVGGRRDRPAASAPDGRRHPRRGGPAAVRVGRRAGRGPQLHRRAGLDDPPSPRVAGAVRAGQNRRGC